MNITCNTPEELPQAAKAFLAEMGERRVYAFNGAMGAGKTTFIAEICRQLGCADDAASPTFSIVNEYRDSAGRPVYHFDFYRLDNPADALEIGIEDYFYSGAPCFIEWPDRLGSLLPEEAVMVDIFVNPDGSRRFTTH